MFLAPQESQEEKPPCITIPEPPRLLRLKAVNRLSIYGFWFLLGVAIANLSRLIPAGWIIYWVAMIVISGYLTLVPPNDGDTSQVATRRITGFALFLSCFAFWDWVLAIVNLPIHIFLWILPVWQCVGVAVVALILLGVVIGLLA